MIKLHSAILIICSIIGFTGHYFQFGIARITPWIPATIGVFIFFVNSRVQNRTGLLKYLPIVPVFVFGIVTAVMCFRFLPQEFQPLRKKIIFCIMAISSWVTFVRILLKIADEQTKKHLKI